MAVAQTSKSDTEPPVSFTTLRAHKPSSAALDTIGQRPRRQQPRPTKQTPYQLANHSKAYLEARSYACGYDFLHSLLTAGASISVPAKPYTGFLAPAAQLALACSLIPYPAITTRSKSADAIEGSDSAIRYLRSVLANIDGPAYSTIRRAFTFPDERSRRRAPAHRKGAKSPSPGATGDIGDIERIAGTASSEQSIWYRADDFWHIVGWAFNCSVMHRERWRRWKQWLEIMLDFLEADWEACVQDSKQEGAKREATLRESLLWRYVSSNEPGQRTTRRRIVRAIFARAAQESSKEFTEVWDQEVAKSVVNVPKEKPVGRIDFETGDLGDYDSDEEDTTMQSTTEHPRRRHRPRRSSSASQNSKDDSRKSFSTNAAGWLGGVDAINLRHRIITLLVQLSQALPNLFTSCSDFFDNMTEEVIHLPATVLPIFLSTSKLPASLQFIFNANLLLPMVTSKIPDFMSIYPTQDHFESSLLPLRATTQSFATNAKVSLILEQMLMYMMKEHSLTPTSALRKAMEAGIKARQSVYGIVKGRNWSEEEEGQAKQLIEDSSERLACMLEILEITAGMAPQLQKKRRKRVPVTQFPSFDTISSLSSPPESDIEMNV